MNLSADGVAPAPRTEGDPLAMNAAYEQGIVFDGQLNIPVVDGGIIWRRCWICTIVTNPSRHVSVF